MPVLLVPGNFLDDGTSAEPKAEIKVMTVEELLPFSFGPEHLPKS